MRILIFCVVACLGASVEAQNTAPPPDALLDAGHCVATAQGDWFGIAQENPYALELGAVSSGGEGELYLIDFTTPTHSEGYAFGFASRGRGSHRELTLEFRTRFQQSVDGTQRVNLVDPPLGGMDAHDGTLAAIEQVGFHTWKVPVAELRGYAGGGSCSTSGAVR